MKRKFAAFDIDGTIGRNSLLLLIVEELLENGHIPHDKKQELEDKLHAHKARAHPHAFKEYSMQSVETLFNHLKSISVDDYKKAVDAVVGKSYSHIYVYTRDLIAELKKEGYFLIALSGSEMYAVEQFMGKLFDFDVVIGEAYEEINGTFTGKVETVFHKKELFLKKLIPKYDLTLDSSIAVGDSAGDITMLEFVENPIAFNPEDALFHTARQRGWKIVIERKNVIYELNQKNGSYILA